MPEHPRLIRIRDLETRLAARDGKPGYEQACDEMRQRIANLKSAHEDDMARQNGFDL